VSFARLPTRPPRLPGLVELTQVDAVQVHHHVLLGHLDALAAPGGLPLNDRGEDADRAVDAGARVAEARARAGGRAVG
jgi:hypothetical protein